MPAVRYYAALFMLMFLPGGLLYWFSIHPFIGFWRRVGWRTSIAIHYTCIALLAGGICLARRPLLSVEYGERLPLAIAGGALLAASIALRFVVSAKLKKRILMGVPELAPDSHGVPLLTDGVYAHLRHPRYVQIAVALVGGALFANYLAAYVTCAASLVILRLIVPLEERELRQRFGRAYDHYCARTPRFIPNFWARR
jgi:protein-S-isoprenylcysteine O-methyltransferase Ste14